MPKGYSRENESHEDFQLWSLTGEFCPEGTIPIRRTTEQDMLRASSVRRFGRKIRRVKRDSSTSGHEVLIISLTLARSQNLLLFIYLTLSRGEHNNNKTYLSRKSSQCH